MDNIATELLKDENCGADYKASNPTVLQAYKGLVAYAPVYQAGCMRDSSGSYCACLLLDSLVPVPPC